MSVKRETVEQRKAMPLATGVLDYFPDALLVVAEVSRIGNEQHHPGEPLHWDKSKSMDQADALMRHLLDRGTLDTDGVRHSAKVAWRALALLQTELDAEAAAEDHISRGGVSPAAPATHDGPCRHGVPCKPEGPTAADWANALLNMGPLQVGRVEPDRTITFQGIDLANGEDVTVKTTITEAGAITHEIVSEEWGNGDGGIFTLLGDRYAVAGVDYRGEWPPDTRVAGRLTCCGQTEHPIDCPQWR